MAVLFHHPDGLFCGFVKFMLKNLVVSKNSHIFASQNSNGVLAHLARARHWQCRGERFESAILHWKTQARMTP